MLSDNDIYTDMIVVQKGIGTKGKMNYDNYIAEVVKRWNVGLKGWPFPEFKNPGDITSVTDVRVLWQALKDKTCCWVSIPEEEVDDWISNFKGNPSGKA